VLVGADHRGVDQDAADLAQVGVRGQQFEQALQAARADPAAEAVVDRVPAAEVAGQVPPRHAGAGPGENRLEEQPVGQLGRPAADELLGLDDERFEDGPVFVREQVPHGVVPREGRKRPKT
jgi:hypothetical protein